MADLEREVFEVLAGRVGAQAGHLIRVAGAVAELDALASYAQVAGERRYVRPTIADEPCTEIIGGRHPVVEHALGWDAYMPADVQLAGWNAPSPTADAGSRPAPQVIVLTGPNMAGKTTYGRMTLLVALMGQCGSFVPAERARLGLVDRVFLRSGAGDDIAGGQSTFMVEMTETAAILRNASGRSLAFFDEVGRGTSTYDGMSIAHAIVEYLARPAHGCRAIFSTHYHELAALEAEEPAVRNFRMDVQETASQVAFTYRVVPGSADRSYGVHVARLAGLPAGVVERAAAVLASLEAGSARNGAAREALGPGEAESPYGSPPHNAVGAADIIAELAEIDINSTTPLQALAALERLQRRARELGDDGLWTERRYPPNAAG
jgi:DNA mismatch repair protein MutS